MYFTCSAIDDIQGHICFVETCQHCQIGEIDVLEEHFFPVEERDMSSLFSSEGRSNLDNLFGSMGLEIPNLDDRIIHSLPSIDTCCVLSIKIELFFSEVVLLEKAELFNFIS